MDDFFDPILWEQMLEINDLQKGVMDDIKNFDNMSKEDQPKFVDKLTLLLDKQQVMYTRLSLSDDPKALELMEGFHKYISTRGGDPNNMDYLFQSFAETIKSLRASIDA